MKPTMIAAIIGMACILIFAFGSGSPKIQTEEYIILEAKSASILETFVKERLRDGYKCEGGINFSSRGYMQALSK
jgi:hypothetical protein